METGLFPLAGTRVRGHRVDCEVVADGGADRLFMDLRLRIGVGRSDADKMRAVETVYDAAAATLRAQLGDAPFALSMELA